MDLSIIIVTYNSENDIKKCISSIIEKTEEIEYEVIIVDNDSKDNTRLIVKSMEGKYPNIKLINSKNRGFNAGNNTGIKNSSGEFIALLNPDTILLNNAFKIIINNMKRYGKVGPCGATLYDENKNLTMSHGVFPTVKETILRSTKLRDYTKYYLVDTSVKAMEVDFPSGADFVFRRELIKDIGLMDEKYFLYFDETDYALRFKKSGLKSYLFTEAKIIHAQGKSTEGTSEFAREQFQKSFIRYLNKNTSRIERYLIIYIKLLEHKVKYLIYSLIKRDSSIIKSHKAEVLFYNKILKELS